ncbi:MAG: GGDEF and EAL domain-containing protein [Hyphomicrobiales bacterium]
MSDIENQNQAVFKKSDLSDEQSPQAESPDNSATLEEINRILGDDTPPVLNGVNLTAEQLGSLDTMLENENECIETVRLKYLSEHDELTGQKNRIKLHEALEDQIIWSRKNNLFGSFVIAAIDNLSIINDTFGYQLGDEVIAAVAYQLAKALRKHDVIGRYSANKFGLILPRCGPDALHSTALRLLNSIADEPIRTSKGIIPVTISIGGVVMPQYANSAQEAVSRSLEALDNTKRKSANSYVVYEHSSEREAHRQRNLQIADEIISALNDKRMHLSLQPIVDASTRKAKHYECLLVMECNDGEMIPAGEFLPIAEKLGLCRLIDYRTLELAIDLLKEDEALHLALNVSSLTTNDPNWLIVMRAKAGRDRSVIERLMVEITETVSINDLEETASFVASLRDLGCSVAIDDFGAGYSSYKNLRVLDVDVVKIDGDFIKDILQCKEDQIFVGSLIALAKSFDMKTVAEWVDNEETACFLRDMGIDYLQGFAMGRPKVVQLKSQKQDASSETTEEAVAQAQ